MAVSVDTVYQRVLALANKEQRGYITPQEYNLFANQAQMDIFEQYFYDINQFRRLPGNDSKYADMVDVLEDKISFFKSTQSGISNGDSLANISNLYRINDLIYNSTPPKIMEEVRYEDWVLLQSTPLTKATNSRPSWYRRDGKIWVSHETESIDVTYIRKPLKVEWSSFNIGSETYDSTNSVNFELHISEETKLVIKILGLAGITLKDPGLYQIAGAEDNKNIQQEKQ